MNENVQILEGNTTRRISPIDKVEVDTTTEGETSMWVPKNDHTTGVLHASENGIYIASEDGYDSYSEVVIRVEKDMVDGELMNDWSYIDPYDGDFDEYGLWDETTIGNFDYDLFNDKELWDDLAVEPLTGDEIKPDSITGIDPDTGETYEYSADENGNLNVDMLPSGIHIVVPPRKLKYKPGEAINFSGIRVYLVDSNGGRYTDSQYPTGEAIELIFPVTVADGEESAYHINIDGNDVYYTGSSGTYEDVIRNIKYVVNGANYCFMNSRGYTFFISLSSFTIEARTLNTDKIITTYNAGIPHYTYGGKTYYFTSAPIDIGIGRSNVDAMEDIASYILDNDEEIEKTMSIPVQWMRSDGEILEDSFTIEISEEGGDEEPSPEPDPWGGYADVSWGGHHYNFNRRLVPPVQYSNGYCWRQQAGEYTVEYTVEQAASMGWIILIR